MALTEITQPRSAEQTMGGRAEDAIPAAVSVALVHNFSLLHEDVGACIRLCAGQLAGVASGDCREVPVAQALAAAGGKTGALLSAACVLGASWPIATASGNRLQLAGLIVSRDH
jgi:geranylgeranyl pyrophosphate synthase